MENKNQHFNKLFKVDTINSLLNIDGDVVRGTVTRGVKHDYERIVKFIRYGFEEGIKFIQDKKKNGN